MKPSLIDNVSRTSQMEFALNWLADAHLVNSCYEVAELTPTFGLSMDVSKFKSYFDDTGLLASLAFNDRTGTI